MAYADINGALARQSAGFKQQESARKMRSVYKDEYTLGKRSLSDLLSAEQDFFQAQTQTEGAKIDAWEASVRYATAVDNLLDILDIDRKAQSGDNLPLL
ncbi:hypothetical protein D3C81_1915440 [compost metagenome]